MQKRGIVKSVAALVGALVILTLGRLPAESADPPASAAAKANEANTAADAKPNSDGAVPRVDLATARDRARLMHDIYSATLDAIHHRYFHGDRAIVPARAMEDVFQEIERQNHLQTRWISASFTPMSISHEPKTTFEKSAAKKIAKGQVVVETVEDGYYRRAGSISLGGGCVSCHAGFFNGSSPTPKFAGLVISIPVEDGAQLTADEPNQSQ